MNPILQDIEKVCDRFPHRIVVADEEKEYTYQTLLQKARSVGCGIHSLLENEKGKAVAIYMDKSPDCVAAMLGVLYSGNFYAVIDTKMPLERTERIFETLQPAVIISDSPDKSEEIAQGQYLTDKTIPMASFDQLANSPIDSYLLEKIKASTVDTDPVYVLYTSGSTGRPKGAIISYHALQSYTDWFIPTFAIDHNTVFGSQTPLYFSMSVSELYGTLRTGGRYQIIPKKYFSFPMHLVQYMEEKKINTIYWVPFALCIVANLDTFRYCKPHHLEKVLFAGESMPMKQLNYWRKHLPDRFYANLFGPTETTDICCYYVVDREFSEAESLPIGWACDNCTALIVDENDQAADQGELLVKGPFLAMGYYNDPEKTAAAFVQNPLQHSYPEAVYRTGDLVRREASGLLLYLGRKDFQIKHMGYRIELGEIEASIGSMEKMESCVCIYDEAEDKIVLIYQGRMKEEVIREQIEQKLPVYMRPNTYIRLRQMPQNANGKIDRHFLKEHYKDGLR